MFRNLFLWLILLAPLVLHFAGVIGGIWLYSRRNRTETKYTTQWVITVVGGFIGLALSLIFISSWISMSMMYSPAFTAEPPNVVGITVFFTIWAGIISLVHTLVIQLIYLILKPFKQRINIMNYRDFFEASRFIFVINLATYIALVLMLMIFLLTPGEYLVPVPVG